MRFGWLVSLLVAGFLLWLLAVSGSFVCAVAACVWAWVSGWCRGADWVIAEWEDYVDDR